MLWADKYRPKGLDNLEVHSGLSEQLKGIVSGGDFPHLLFYGPAGAGKKTRVMALLRHVYGPGVEKLKSETRIFKVGSERDKDVEMTVISSNYHLELSPSDAGLYDRFVIQDVLKEIASSSPLDSAPAASASSSASSSSSAPPPMRTFKVVVLNEVDRLSREAQQALRRTMEKYMSTCRLICVAQSTSKVIDPVRSRCLCIRVPAPSQEEVIQCLQAVCKKEGLTLPQRLAIKIAFTSERNLRRALLMLEATKVQQYPFSETQDVMTADWERLVTDIARMMLEEQSPKRIYEVRGKVYELLTNCIPPDVIMKKLTLELLKKVDAELKYDIAQWAAVYEHNLKLGTKAIFHIEAFVAKFMFVYRRFMIRSLS